MLAVLLLLIAAAAASDTPAWLVPFGGAGAGAFAIVAAGFMTNRLYTGTDFRRVIQERNDSQQRERDQQDYIREHVIPLIGESNGAILAATRLLEKMAER